MKEKKYFTLFLRLTPIYIGLFLALSLSALALDPMTSDKSQPLPPKTETAQKKQEKIKIGAILSLTGELSFVGQSIRKGIEMALSEGLDKRFEVIFEDDLTANRVAAVSALNSLVNTHQVKAVLSTAQNTISALAPILQKSKTVGIVVWDSNNKIASIGDYVFGFGFSTEHSGIKMANFAVENLKLKKIGIISANDEWSEIISKAFINRLEELGGTITFKETVNTDQRDFKSIINRPSYKNSEAIYAPLSALNLLSWIRQSRELRYKGHLLTGDSLSQNEVNELGAVVANDLYATQAWVENPEFQKRYRDSFGKDIDNLNLGFVALGYDALNCIAQMESTLNKSNTKFDSETLKNSLLKDKCTGILGTIDFAGKHISNRVETLLKVEAGKFKVVN